MSASNFGAKAVLSASTDATRSISSFNTTITGSFVPVNADLTQSRGEVVTLQSQATQSIGELGTLQSSTTQSLNASASFTLASSSLSLGITDVRTGITGSNTLTAQVSHSFNLATGSIKTQVSSSDVEITASRAVYSGSLALDEVTFVSGGVAGGRGATVTGSTVRPMSDIFGLPGGAANPTTDKLTLRNDITVSSAAGVTAGQTDSFADFIATCVLPGTKILIKRNDKLGKTKIENTRKDDLIYVFDFKTKEFKWSPIKKILNNVIKDGWYHIITEEGYELKCSKSHLLYHPDYSNNAIEVDKLGVGGQLYIFRNNKIVEDKIKFIDAYTNPVEVWNYELEFTHNYISNGILSHNAVPKQFTAGHRYFSSENLEKGDLVRLNKNNEIVKTTEQKDTSVLGIVWYKFCLNSFGVDGASAEDNDKDIFKRDSMGRIYTDEQMKTKKLWKIAAIGDTRHNNSRRKEQELEGLKICNQNGEVKKGDLLCSSDIPGYAMRQSTEFIITSVDGIKPTSYDERQNMNSFTIGKSMEDVEFDENGKAIGVYGYLYCG